MGLDVHVSILNKKGRVLKKDWLTYLPKDLRFTFYPSCIMENYRNAYSNAYGYDYCEKQLTKFDDYERAFGYLWVSFVKVADVQAILTEVSDMGTDEVNAKIMSLNPESVLAIEGDQEYDIPREPVISDKRFGVRDEEFWDDKRTFSIDHRHSSLLVTSREDCIVFGLRSSLVGKSSHVRFKCNEDEVAQLAKQLVEMCPEACKKMGISSGIEDDTKYGYSIRNSAETETAGIVKLTKAEAAIVAYAINKDNWDIYETGDFSGYCEIDVDNPIPCEEVDKQLVALASGEQVEVTNQYCKQLDTLREKLNKN